MASRKQPTRRLGIERLWWPLLLVLPASLALEGQQFDPKKGPPGTLDNPILLQWFFGAPDTWTSIGEGETVQWIWWDDRYPYSVEGEGAAQALFQGNGAGANVVQKKGFTLTVTFNEAGEFKYHSHNQPLVMTGRVLVKPKVNIGGVVLPWFWGVSYGAASAIIKEGDTVTWEFEDDLGHSLASTDGHTDVFVGKGTGRDIITEDGFQYKHTFTKAGEYLYFCPLHTQEMRGNITVLPKDTLVVEPPPKPAATVKTASISDGGTDAASQAKGASGLPLGLVFTCAAALLSVLAL